MQKFAEDDRIEQMKQAARRMKQLEHRKAVDALIEERRRLIAEKELEEKKQEEMESEIARYKAAVIEQERQRLLREHASKLAGFLPKVLKKNLIDRVYFVINAIWISLMRSSETNSKKLVSLNDFWMHILQLYSQILFSYFLEKTFHVRLPYFGDYAVPVVELIIGKQSLKFSTYTRRPDRGWFSF
jgi:hypothetical protein